MVCKFSEKQKPRHFSADGGRNSVIILRMSANGPELTLQLYSTVSAFDPQRTLRAGLCLSPDTVGSEVKTL